MPTRSPTTDLFFTAFAHSSVGMALISLQGHWIEVNPALCRIIGYTRDELLALTFQEITHPDDLDGDLTLLNKVLANEIDFYNLEKRYRHASGRIIWGLLTVTLSRDAGGNPECLIGQMIDITEHKKAVEDRDAFFTLSPDLLAITGTDGYLLQVNPAWTDALGWTQDELSSRPFIDFVHPDDVAATLAEAGRIYRGGVARGFRNRYRHARGGYRWLEWSTRALNNGLMYCSVRDVTTQIENEERLRSQEQKIRLLIENANDAFLGMNERGIITEWNKQAELTFGWSAQEAIGQPMVELLTPQRMRRQHLDGVQAFLRHGQLASPRKRVEVPALRKDGSEILVEITVGALPFDGELYFHAFLRDVSEQRRMSEQLHHRATHDFLTGLPNRYEFMGRLQRAIEAASRQPPRPLVLLFIDLDGFKAVNDICGHEMGDAVLIEFGRRLGQSVRRTDQVARLAGDEFVVLLDHVANAELDAEGVCSKILGAAGRPYPQLAGRTEVGASIGVALYQPADSADTLLSRADAAMYVAKNAGKNRVAFLRDGLWVVRAGGR
ncbi:PAS domain S-box protein [Massilia consociata]|uniref:PAS domain S-box protein n=1 Tax=Massilia consociata TaxID=760117 RepID=A0ABV6FHW4_9BURK